MPERFKTIKEPGEGLFKDRGSKFLAFAFPVGSLEEVKKRLQELAKEYNDARHHCYAYVLGADKEEVRENDAGEPSGTAGRPIHGQIKAKDLTNILVVVIRYFGGTKLGTGGLIQAYKEATKEALDKAEIVEEQVLAHLHLTFDHSITGEVERIIGQNKLARLAAEYTDKCRMTLGVPPSRKKATLQAFKGLNGLEIKEDE